MPRKGEMSEQDVADELIRASAHHYNVVIYIPQKNSRVHLSDESLDKAITFAESVYTDPGLPRVRSAMVYAVDEHDRFALMGTTNRFAPKFKPNVVKIY